MENVIKKTIAAFFVLFLFFGFIRSGAYLQLSSLAEFVSKDFSKSDNLDITISNIENDFIASLWNKRQLVNINGEFAKMVGMKSLYGNEGMYINDENVIVSRYNETKTDYEYEQIVSFDQFLQSNNINFLYVNAPIKYLDDKEFISEFGIKTFCNRNADVFLKRIEEAGINHIDLRENIVDEGLCISKMFYRTDHHWTTSAAFWSSRVIADGLNDYCGYSIDLGIYDSSLYAYTDWESCWLGEQGRKIAQTYVGLDDFTEIKPVFPTSYLFKTDNGYEEGTFDDFINQDVYNIQNDVYENESWHYSYLRRNCINNNVKYGKVLLICDSYSQAVEPFLSLGVHEIDSIVLRDMDESFSIRNYILDNHYDTVVILYAQFMIGAHDNVQSSNYNMFTLDK